MNDRYQPIRSATARLRIVRNLGWLAGSKAVGALLSLVYLGLAARALGPVGFGSFAMVLAYGQAVASFIQFQSWQIVIGFGARHLEKGRMDRLEALISFALWLDIVSAMLSALLAYAAAHLAGRLLAWSPETIQAAQLFGLSLAGWARATPTGVLRLLDRFDQLSRAEVATPVIRLVGAVLAVRTGSSIENFLLIWAVSEIATAFLLWQLAARALAGRGASIRPRWPSGVLADNPRLWRFAWLSNATASVNLIWQQFGTLAIGGAIGPAMAGNFRLAFQIAQGLAKPTLLLGRVIYPEFSRMDGCDMPQMLKRTCFAGSAAGLLLILLTVLLGRPILGLIAGIAYFSAAPLLVILIIAVAIDLAMFGLEPALLAAGRAGGALIGRAVGAAAYAVLLLAFIGPFGAFGAAWAAVFGSAVAAILSLHQGYRAGLWAPRPISDRR